LQRKTDTLTGRELSRPVEVESGLKQKGKDRNMELQVGEIESLTEYRWKIEDDDDNLKEDVLAPKYTSY
jgi:hypothetical protein